MILLRGQRAKLSDLISHGHSFSIRGVVNASKLNVDFSCFGLDANTKLPDELYMSFFNQPVTPCGAVRFECSTNNAAVFLIDLQKLPVHIERLIITAAIDGDGTMSQLINGSVSLWQSNIEVAAFTFVGSDFAAERALMLMQIYRKEGNWRVCATGHGFNGGLDTLVRYFGGTIAESPTIIQELDQQLPHKPAIPQKTIEQTTNKPSQSFLQRFFNPFFSYKTSTKNTNKQNTSKLSSYWKPQGTSVKIANVVIEGGLLYFGSGLGSIGGHYKTEPALINPKLSVSKIASANYQQRLLSYWPSYTDTPQQARAAYIKWLVAGRNDPLADVGYVFLYFYGLERRALVDAKVDSTAKAELPIIIQEVERLLKIYHSNHSFRSYATGLLDLLKLDDPAIIAQKQYLASPPDFKLSIGKLPLMLKLALGQLAIDGEHVSAEWAYAWLMADPTTQLNTPARRCAVEFKKLFFAKYYESFGNGISLSVNKTKIKVSYNPASASFLPNRIIEKKLELPDVTAPTSHIKKLQTLAGQCSEILNGYSRFLGRNPDSVGTFDALLELPYSLWTEQQKHNIQTIKHRLETTQTPVAIELKAWLPEWQTLTKIKVTTFINRLTEAGLGMEPDPRFGGAVPNPDTKVILFNDKGTWDIPNPRYTTAALTLHLAVIVSLADGNIGETERALLIQHIEGWLHLEPAEKNRLHAHLRWLLSERPDFKAIKKRVEILPISTREGLADFLVLVAYADNKISPNEVKVLEKIYKILNLDVQSLYGKLHGTSTDEPVTVRPQLPKSGGFLIPNLPEPKADFQLDMSRVTALKKESKKVTDMLVAIFEQDVATEIELPSQVQPVNNKDENLLGLDTAHSNLIKLLCSRTQWTRIELEEIAADCDMMLDGALEHINEAAYDTFDAPLTEGDDPIDINQDILKELLCD